MRRALVRLLVILALLAPRAAVADPEPPLRITVPTTISDGAGNSLALPPGYFLPDPTWNALDAELRRLQERETRLGAENTSLRASAAMPGWWWVAVGVAAGAAAGYAVGKL